MPQPIAGAFFVLYGQYGAVTRYADELDSRRQRVSRQARAVDRGCRSAGGVRGVGPGRRRPLAGGPTLRARFLGNAGAPCRPTATVQATGWPALRRLAGSRG